MIPIRVIRRRIRSIQNTAKVTRAMEMIAASKMRQAQMRVLASRPYAAKMMDVVAHLGSQIKPGEQLHPLLVRREPQKIALIHITADRGLCGGLNANMNRKTIIFLQERGLPSTLVTVGRKGRNFMTRYGQPILAEFTQIGDRPLLIDTLPISRIAIEEYVEGNADCVYLAYTRFVSTVSQEPVIRELLPIEPRAAEYPIKSSEYIYEPSVSLVLENLLPRYVEMEVYQAILESVASEQSARMVSMRNATDNALEMIDDLTLALNKARQELITEELLDIAGGVSRRMT